VVWALPTLVRRLLFSAAPPLIVPMAGVIWAVVEELVIVLDIELVLVDVEVVADVVLEESRMLVMRES
jgi:hypothetical protein